MKRIQKRFLTMIVVVSIFLLGIFTFIELDSDFGRLEVKTVFIPDGNKEICGLLYRPYYASATTPFPGVVIAHGISGSKEMMSSLGLELSRQNFVVLCLDLLGHGGSGGTVQDGKTEPSLGVLSAVQYLGSQSYVNASAIGLVGHSLGGGAVRATFAEDFGIGASVLIAGGLGDISSGTVYGVLNSSFPKNLLVIVGKYDALFNLIQITTQELPPVFGTQQEVVPGIVYGNFSSQTARKLVMPATTHLFEPFDATTISEIAVWMKNSFGPREFPVAGINSNLTYIGREAAIMISLATFLGIIFLAFLPLAHIIKPHQKNAIKEGHGTLSDWKIFVIWGTLGLTLFLPMVFVGFAISFPPLIFGASIAWWMLSVGLIGLLVLFEVLPRFSKVKIRFKTTLMESFDRNHLFTVLVLFVLMLAGVSILEGLFNIDLRILSPIFRSLTSSRRIFTFFAFLPFFLTYFLVEGCYFHELHDWTGQKQGPFSELLSCCKIVLGKVAPFVAVICLQYAPVVLFNLWIFPSFVGFLVEFLWLIAPIFVITTTSSWWFYKNTNSVWPGAVFNALMMAWVATNVFPF